MGNKPVLAFTKRAARKIRRTLTNVTLLPERKKLWFGPYPGIKPNLIPTSDPMHKGLADALERCRSFPYDLEVFRNIEPETKYLPFLTDPQKSSLDIGANLGFYTAMLASLSATVFAWEANPHLIPFLMINAHRYPNVYVLPLAASKNYGEAVFNIPRSQDGDVLSYSGSGSVMNQFMMKMGITSTPLKMPVLPIDALRLERVGFMKIDVEGSECDVLEGAAATIERCRPSIIVENEFRHNSECRKVFDFLAARDYQGYFFDRISQALKVFEDFSLDKNQLSLLGEHGDVTNPQSYVYNFMFTPREADRLKLHLGK